MTAFSTPSGAVDQRADPQPRPEPALTAIAPRLHAAKPSTLRRPDPARPGPELAARPTRDGSMSLGDLVDAYMAAYAGRDTTLASRFAWWLTHLGAARPIGQIDDDDVFDGMQALRQRRARYYAGKDADGRAIYKAKAQALSPATLNRYLAALSLLLSWALRQRHLPKGWTHPCRSVAFEREDNARVRFLTDAERRALLAECRRAVWPRLHLLVTMAITTGARRGELLGLRWRDLDLDRATAIIDRTKNNDRKTLVLVPSVIDELRTFKGAPGSLVFCSRLRPDQPMKFEKGWLEAVAAAGIKNFRFHDLRHTHASYLAQNGATLLEIADSLGHRQLGVTKRYSHLTTHHKARMVNRVFGGIDDGQQP